MTQEHANHSKVRFTRDDRLDLNRMPSASTLQGRRFLSRGARLIHGVSKGILLFFLFAASSVGVLAVILATSGISNAYFAEMARSSLQRLAGPQTRTQIGEARLSLDSTGNLAFEANDVAFAAASQNSEIAKIGTVRMGLKALPLLLGKIEIARLEINDVLLSQSGDTSGMDRLLASLKRPDGLYNPGALPAFVHQLVDNLRGQFQARKLSELSVSNVSFAPTTNALVSLPLIKSLALAEPEEGTISVAGLVSQGSQNLAFSGQIFERDFDLTVGGLTFGTSTNSQTEADVLDGASPITPNGDVSVRMRGLSVNAEPALQLEIDLARFDYRNRRGARILGDGTIRAELVQNVEKVEIQSSQLTVGSNSGVFTGAIGPAPLSDAGSPHYRFEIVSNDTSLSPRDSPEKRVSAAVAISGIADLANRELSFSRIGVRTLAGQLYGQGSVKFGVGSPEMIFALKIPEISMTDAKQLWPSIFAGGARLWVLDHVYGGTLTNSNIDIAYAAGSLWPRPAEVPIPLPSFEQVSADFTVNNARFDVIGDLPPIRDASGTVSVRGANTVVKVDSGTAYLENGETVTVSNGTLAIPVVAGKPVIGDLLIDVSGDASSIAKLSDREPIKALSKAPISASDLSGSAVASIKASFPLRKVDSSVEKKWSANVEFKNLSIAKEFSGQKLSDADGTLAISKSLTTLTAKGKLNGVPATLSVVEPLGRGAEKRKVSAKLILDDKARAKIAPGLKDILTGPVEVSLDGAGGNQNIEADLTNATLSLPWAGWSKGPGVAATATLVVDGSDKGTTIRDLSVKGKSFSISGDINLLGTRLTKASFSNVSLNKGDQISVDVVNGKDGFDVAVSGNSLDLRALLKRVTGSFEKAAATTGGVPIRVKANVNAVTGFNGEQLLNVVASYSGKGSTIRSFSAKANSQDGGAIAIENKSGDGNRTVNIQTTDGGSLLRFLDIYDKMQGGRVTVVLATKGDGPLAGEVDARGFTIVGEPRLKSIVGTPVSPDGQSLSKVTKDKIVVSRVKFDRGNALIEKGEGYLKLDRGILRSDQIGLSYSGTLYDARGRINMVGTFMPAFGLNKLFSEIPIFGDILGNGRDRGLIGITFKLAGNAKSPELSVNPMSLIAPGIFRQIFEYQ